MTDTDRLTLLREAVERHGSQAKVGKIIGYSTGAISQALSNSYGGSLDTLLGKVEECFGKEIIECPELGEIHFYKCVKERRRPFSAGNPSRVRQYRACKRCKFNTDIKNV
jgi:hypothetical protein